MDKRQPRRQWSLACRRSTLLGVAVSLGCAPSPTVHPEGEKPTVVTLPAEVRPMCWSQGPPERREEGQLQVRASKSRGVISGAAGERALLRFAYLGPTQAQSRLGSGRVRQQIGLKLRAADTCNVLYVMWRIAPTAEIVVSRKSNPGQRRHAECGNGGYRNLTPQSIAAPPRLEPGSVHELSARIEAGLLQVLLDGRPVWKGWVGASEAVNRLPQGGMSGLRSDNVEFEIVGVEADGVLDRQTDLAAQCAGSSIQTGLR